MTPFRFVLAAATGAALGKKQETCFEADVAYTPFLLPYHKYQGFHESTAEECQSKCESVSLCGHFAWWEDKVCHLYPLDAKKDLKSTHKPKVSGPPNCDNDCFETGFKYDPIDMNKESRTEEKSAADCQERCYNTIGCKTFTFWSNGGCHVQDRNAKKVKGGMSLVSGPSNCNGDNSATGNAPGSSPTPSPAPDAHSSQHQSQSPAPGGDSLEHQSSSPAPGESPAPGGQSPQHQGSSPAPGGQSPQHQSQSPAPGGHSPQHQSQSPGGSPSPAPGQSPSALLARACLEPHTKYEPDMDVATGGHASDAGSAVACQFRCQNTDGCAHFSWWLSGSCHLQDGAAKKVVDAGDVIAGPLDCPQDVYCFATAGRFEPLDMNREHKTDAASPEECQERCQNTPDCKHFTFFPDGGCHIQDRKARLESGKDDVIVGPRHCVASTAMGNAPGAAPALAHSSSHSPSPSHSMQGGLEQRACFMNRKIFKPLDMPGHKSSKEKSAVKCQHRCMITEGCEHFSWWANGKCHIQDHAATEYSVHDDVVSGRPHCPKRKYCYKNAVTYKPIDMNEEEATQEESAVACQERCMNTPECRTFVFTADGSCHIQDASSAKEMGDADVTSGPAVCDIEAPDDSPEMAVRKFTDGEIWAQAAAVGPWTTTAAGLVLTMTFVAGLLVARRRRMRRAQQPWDGDDLPALLEEDL